MYNVAFITTIKFSFLQYLLKKVASKKNLSRKKVIDCSTFQTGNSKYLYKKKKNKPDKEESKIEGKLILIPSIWK